MSNNTCEIEIGTAELSHDEICGGRRFANQEQDNADLDSLLAIEEMPKTNRRHVLRRQRLSRTLALIHGELAPVFNKQRNDKFKALGFRSDVWLPLPVGNGSSFAKMVEAERKFDFEMELERLANETKETSEAI